MGYLNEFQAQIVSKNFPKFVQLWEEYCTCDEIDIEELLAFFKLVKSSDFAKLFGAHVEQIMKLWESLPKEEDKYLVLREVIDIQTTNSPALAELSLEALKSKYSKEPAFHDFLKLVGLRMKDNFQGALSNFDLLAHIKKGHFVFHPGGWGAGEIIDFSILREQLTIEFQNVAGLKHIGFVNAFKSLVPLTKEHFLARRFADPDLFEKQAKEDPVEIVKLLLHDLGPKTAGEIKDELCELVIPEKDWSKWWQNTRSKLKKDVRIASPESLKEPFVLRKADESHESQLTKALTSARSPIEKLQFCYSFIRDHASRLKEEETRQLIEAVLHEIEKEKNSVLSLQVEFCRGIISGKSREDEIKKIISSQTDLISFLNNIEIVAFKKQALTALKNHHEGWQNLFITLLEKLPQGTLKEYMFKELYTIDPNGGLKSLINRLQSRPENDPELFFWLYNKLISEKKEFYPPCDKALECSFTEGLLVLLHKIENEAKYKELTRKIYLGLSNKRYAQVRAVLEKCSLTFAKEFLLLASKCHTLSDKDQKILRSLAEVVHPSLCSGTTEKPHEEIFWATEAGHLKMQERIKEIATKEVVENAREVEAARALGDLRENSEYKAAVEKRSRLQGELKKLSHQMHHSRVITPNDVSTVEVSVGSKVIIEDSKGQQTTYTVLGPWEADPDLGILSLQSKFAQAMLGLEKGETFTFKDEEYRIVQLTTVFEKK